MKGHEAGAKTVDVYRKHGISDATFYKYNKTKYGGMAVSDARKLKALEDENAKLKKLLDEAIPDNAILKDIASKKGTPDVKWDAVVHICAQARGEPASSVRGFIGGSVEHAIS
nr:transposase [Ochrobactrum vermis]